MRPGQQRESRGHHHVGGVLGERHEERHWVSAIAIIATVIGTAVSAYGQYQQGQSNEAAARYNQKVAENQATQARQAAAIQEQQIADQARRVRAQNAVAIGASGVRTEGSPLLVLMDNAANADYQQQIARYQGEVGATGYLSQANLLRFQGSQAAQAGLVGAGSTLLTGASQIGATYLRNRPPAGATGYTGQSLLSQGWGYM